MDPTLMAISDTAMFSLSNIISEVLIPPCSAIILVHSWSNSCFCLMHFAFAVVTTRNRMIKMIIPATTGMVVDATACIDSTVLLEDNWAINENNPAPHKMTSGILGIVM